MKYLDETVKEDLAKSSTILQCILSILDFECNKFHIQPEVIWARANSAMVDLDGINEDEIIDICIKVNKQFARKDKRPSCYQEEHRELMVKCESVSLDEYVMLI